MRFEAEELIKFLLVFVNSFISINGHKCMIQLVVRPFVLKISIEFEILFGLPCD